MFKGYLYYFLNQQVSRIHKIDIIEEAPKIKCNYIDTSYTSLKEIKTLIDLKYNMINNMNNNINININNNHGKSG